MLYNREEYILRSRLGEEILHLDPMGGEETKITIGRSEKSFGIFTTVAQNLQFIGVSKTFLDLNYLADNVNAYVELVQKRKNPITDDWDISYKGYLDMKTRKIVDGKFTIDFIEGGFKQTLESQAKEKFEVNRIESITGKPITQLQLDELIIEGREIFQMTKFYSENEKFTHHSGYWSSGGNTRQSFSPFPYKILSRTHEFVEEPQPTIGIENRWVKDIGNGIIRNVPRDIPDFPVNFNWNLEILKVFRDETKDFRMWVVVDRYSGGIDMNFEERFIIKQVPFPFPGMVESGSHSMTLDLKQGETYTIGLYSVGVYGSALSDGWIVIDYNFKGSLDIPEDSFYERTGAPFIPAFSLGNRLTEIYTGKPKFKSSFLESGDWKDLGFTTGGWLRNLKKKVETTNKDGVILNTEYQDWPMAISFDEFYQSINAVLPVGFGIVSEGAKQFLRMEPIRFFFQPSVTMYLGEVSSFEEGTAANFAYSFVTTGYTKGGNYEQELGLDEPNIQTTWGSPIIRGDNKYEVLGPSRTDSYAVEQTRRFPASEHADRDTPFDKDNFLIDAKLLNRSSIRNYYGVRLWQDDFEIAPTGIYSPNTAFNLRLSPANNMKRHSVMFNAAIHEFQQDMMRHANSKGNSELLTKLPGKPMVKENNPIPVPELRNPIFEAEEYNCTVPRTQEMMDQINGTSVINGEVVNNYLGIAEFKYKGQVYRGYLFTAEIDDVINIKLMKAYGF